MTKREWNPWAPESPVVQTHSRVLGTVFVASEGRWAVRLRCPDGTIRQFFTEPVFRVRPRRRPMRQSVRFDVLARDKHTCRYCGRSAPDVPLSIDHVVPVAAGGSNDPSNLVVACEDCNLGKSDRMVATMVATDDALSVG